MSGALLPGAVEPPPPDDDLDRALGLLVMRAALSIRQGSVRPIDDRAGPSAGAARGPRGAGRHSSPGNRTSASRPTRPSPSPRVPGLVAIGPPVPVRPVADPSGLDGRRVRLARGGLWLRNIGCVVFVVLAYQWWGTGFEQRQVQRRLRATFEKAVVTPASGGVADRPPTTTRAPGAPGAARPAPAPLPGGVVSHLEIPAIGIDQYAVEGTTEDDLHKGVGHYSGTPLPGQPGNAAFAGHRTTYGAPFNRLGDLKPGETILATTMAGRFLYVVSGRMTVSPSQTSILADYGDNRLTLTTCTPEFSATQRLVVVAELLGPAPASVPPTAVAPPLTRAAPKRLAAAVAARLGTSAGRGFDLVRLPSVLLWAALMVVLGFAYRPVRRRLPPLSATAVLSCGWAAVLLLFCQALNRFLPSYV